MKRMAILLLLLTPTVFAGSIVWRSKGEKWWSKMQVNIKDLPEQNITITAPTDPSFDDLMTSYLRGGSPSAADLKPSSVFVNNRGEKTIIGLRLRWECTRADGTTVSKQIDEASPAILMDEGALDHTKALESASIKIKPNSSRVFSIAIPSNHFEKDNLSQQINLQALQRLNAELAQYADITVSLDGVFFDDGTFVGPDLTGYFIEMEAMVRAKYDLFREMQVGLELGKSADEILSPAEALANGPRSALGENPTATDYYEYYKQLFAREPSGIKKVFGDEQSRRQAMVNRVKRISKPWPKLRKL